MKTKIPHIGFFSLCTLLLFSAIISCSKSDKPTPAPVAGFKYERVNANFILPRYQLTDTSKNATEWSWNFNGYATPTTVQNPVVTFYRINSEVDAILTVKNGTGQSTDTVSFNTGPQSSHIASYTFPASNIYEDFSKNNKEWSSKVDPVSEAGVNGKGFSGKFIAGDTSYAKPPENLLNTAFGARNQISVSMWVKVSDLANPASILGLSNVDLSTHMPVIFYNSKKLFGRWPGGDIRTYVPSQEITANTWYHIVLNGDGLTDKHEMFVNGVSAGSSNEVVSFGSGNNTLFKTYLGWSVIQGQERYFSGNLSAVRFFNRIISQEEVNALYHEFD